MQEKKVHPEESNQAEINRVCVAAIFLNCAWGCAVVALRSGRAQGVSRTLSCSIQTMRAQKCGGCF